MTPENLSSFDPSEAVALLTKQAMLGRRMRRVKEAAGAFDTLKGMGTQAANWMMDPKHMNYRLPLVGAGVGGLVGLVSSLQRRKEERAPISSALTGALAGGALGLGGAAAKNLYDRSQRGASTSTEVPSTSLSDAQRRVQELEQGYSELQSPWLGPGGTASKTKGRMALGGAAGLVAGEAIAAPHRMAVGAEHAVDKKVPLAGEAATVPGKSGWRRFGGWLESMGKTQGAPTALTVNAAKIPAGLQRTLTAGGISMADYVAGDPAALDKLRSMASPSAPLGPMSSHAMPSAPFPGAQALLDAHADPAAVLKANNGKLPGWLGVKTRAAIPSWFMPGMTREDLAVIRRQAPLTGKPRRWGRRGLLAAAGVLIPLLLQRKADNAKSQKLQNAFLAGRSQ